MSELGDRYSSHLDQAKVKTGERLKNQGVFILGILVALVLIGTVSENNRASEAAAKAKAIDAKNVIRESCFNVTDEDLAMKAGPVGSSARKMAVDAFYDDIWNSYCVTWKDDTITTNPFYKVKEADVNSSLFELAYYQSLKGWNGQELLTGSSCADGWNSPSIGKSGACSHHGGVIIQFEANTKYQLISALQRAGIQTIYAPGSTVDLMQAHD